MAELLFEIWHDETNCSYECSPVSERADRLRAKMSPRALKVHQFLATSDFDAAQKNCDWHGWGRWKPEKDWEAQFFTDDEAEAQRRYLALREA